MNSNGEETNAFRMNPPEDPEDPEDTAENLDDVVEEAVERADEEQAADLGEKPSPEERRAPLAQDEP